MEGLFLLKKLAGSRNVERFGVYPTRTIEAQYS